MQNSPAEFSTEFETPAFMPSPEIYEQELIYWPWRELIGYLAGYLTDVTPQGGVVLDYMSGTGTLLRQLSLRRADLAVSGCDINLPFVKFAAENQHGAAFFHVDARRFSPSRTPDVVTCTAGLHHLAFDEHGRFLKKIASECSPKTIVIIGEEAIPAHNDEVGRKRSALALNVSLLEYGIEHNWPDSLLQEAVAVMKRDILLSGEFKRSVSGWRSIIGETFVITKEIKTWIPNSGGGDVIFICHLP